MNKYIKFFGIDRQYQNLKDELLEATDKSLSTGVYVNGEFTSEFEYWLSKKTKTEHAITVSSGTSALEIIARYKKYYIETYYYGHNIDSTKIVIPNITYPATLNAFLTAGYTVEIAETDNYGIVKEPHTYDNYSVCLVGLFGRKPLHEYTYPNTFSFIIDGAQHWLVSEGDVGLGMSISFDPTKNLNSSGNGGAIVTNNNGLAAFARNFKRNGAPKFNGNGTNSNMSEQDCAQLLVRTRYIDIWQLRRKKIAQYYCEKFKELPIRCLTTDDAPHMHQKFVIYCPDRYELSEFLKKSNIETKVHYPYTMHSLVNKNYIKNVVSNIELIGVSEMLSLGLLSLPIYPELTDAEVEHIANSVCEFFKIKA